MYDKLLLAYVNVGDVLSGWKIYKTLKEIYPDNIPERPVGMQALAKAHFGKHPDYLRDMIKFSGVSLPLDMVISDLMNVTIRYGQPDVALDLYKQTQTDNFKSINLEESTKVYMKVLAYQGHVDQVQKMYESREKDLDTNNTLLLAYTKDGKINFDNVIKTYQDMPERDLDSYSYVTSIGKQRGLEANALKEFISSAIDDYQVPRDTDDVLRKTAIDLGLKWKHEQVFKL
jgi:hypothetical protein